MERHLISKSFLFILIFAVLFVCYKIFRPFIDEIVVAAILVSIFYKPYERLIKFLRGRKNVASLIMCLLVALLVILPLVNFIAYAANRSVVGYERTLAFVNQNEFESFFKSDHLQKFNAIGLSSETIKDVAIDVAKKLNEWLVSGAGTFIKGTTNFFISLLLIIFTMFFFFIDGKTMVEKLMYWTPLPNKYDKEIFKKFQDVSLSTMISTFVTAIAQGFIGGFGLMVVGVPAFFAGIAMAFLSLLPYFGTALVWFPVAIYLLVIGEIWQGLFLIAWGVLVVSTVDNLIRAYLIKGKAQVHPIFVIFSILGGIALFGFWGIVFGPLVIALTVTILHIYEIEYETILER